jgi:hypothetical protein
VAVGLISRQRAKDVDPDPSEVNHEEGRGVQKPNGSVADSAGRGNGRPETLIPPRGFLSGTVDAGE